MKKYTYVFGPVPSRRLGMSLGVDIIPMKTCTFDCVYCQIGRTPKKRINRSSYVPIDAVLKEIKEVLASDTPVDYVTISGAGEPTLNRDIGTLIRRIQEIPGARVAVITNASLLSRPDVRHDLLAATVVLPSLDFGTDAALEKINRPIGGLTAESIFNGLQLFSQAFSGKLWLEIFMVNHFNTSTQEMSALRDQIRKIAPDRIDINTAVRPPRESFVTPLPAEEMEKIRAFFGEKANVIANFKQSAKKELNTVDAARIMDSLERRPQTATDLATALKVNIVQLEKLLQQLSTEEKITGRRHGNALYYELPDNS